MKLGVRLRRYVSPLGTAVSNSKNSWRERRGIVLTLSADDGSSGYGEAAPLPGFSRDTLDDAERALATLAGAPSNALEKLVEIGVKEPHSLFAELERAPLVAPESARFALEAALFDLVSQRRGEPFVNTLGAAMPDGARVPNAPLQHLPVAALLGGAPSVAEARAWLDAGFQTLKIKIGISSSFVEELAALRALRSELGFAFRLRLDANRAFSPDTARERLAALCELDPEFVEEPCHGLGFELRRPSLPIALDESLTTPNALTPAQVSEQRIAAVILKPSVLGGVVETLRFAERARSLGIAALLSHAFEGPIAFRALSALAFCVGAQGYAHGLGPHPALGAPNLPTTPGEGSPQLFLRGSLLAPELDEAALRFAMELA